MGARDDGSDDLDRAIDEVRSENRSQIADRIEKWSISGVNISWTDFVERAVLEMAVRYLRKDA